MIPCRFCLLRGIRLPRVVALKKIGKKNQRLLTKWRDMSFGLLGRVIALGIAACVRGHLDIFSGFLGCYFIFVRKILTGSN